LDSLHFFEISDLEAEIFSRTTRTESLHPHYSATTNVELREKKKEGQLVFLKPRQLERRSEPSFSFSVCSPKLLCVKQIINFFLPASGQSYFTRIPPNLSSFSNCPFVNCCQIGQFDLCQFWNVLICNPS